MVYEEAKVYFDGSHYIGIPYVPNETVKRPKEPEEEIEVEEPIKAESYKVPKDIKITDYIESKVDKNSSIEQIDTAENGEIKVIKRKTTRKELFEGLYKETLDMPRFEQKEYITELLSQYFKSKEAAEIYVNTNFERKSRNLICRRKRLIRKVNLQDFNYFCTFTYDNAKHTEDSFKMSLRNCLKNFCYRAKWKYVGVWERSSVKNRLHFHGLFYIPEGTMPGKLQTVKDYSPKKKKVQTTIQNTYFNYRFGRSDLEPIKDKYKLGDSISYILKYIEKSGERIVYSRGLPQYFISDIISDDVVCRFGAEGKKFLLYDNFNCFDEGVLVGPVSKEVISQMPKTG